MQQSELLFDGQGQPGVSPPIKRGDPFSELPYKWQREILRVRARNGETVPAGLLKPIDYSFRPASYWATDSLRHLVAIIKGAERKKKALQLIGEGRLEEAGELVLADSLSDKERTLLGKIHPALMGGEYLPDSEAGEVEIARVTLASATQDVISIRACSTQSGIRYAAVDEYETGFTVKPALSKRPLSLRQLIRLIETAKGGDLESVGLGLIQFHFSCNDEPAEAFAGFMSFSSEFYPDLVKHFWFALQRWLQQNSRRRVTR